MERQRRSFTEEYKRQAVELVCRSITSVAKDPLRPWDIETWLVEAGPIIDTIAGDSLKRRLIKRNGEGI